MRQEIRNVYLFNELSETAKDRARDWYRSCIDANDFDGVVEDAVNMGALLGIEIAGRPWTNTYGHTGETPKIYWSVCNSQGDGASFEGRYEYKKGSVKAILAETGAGREDASKGDRELLRIAQALQDLQRKAFYSLVATATARGRYLHSGTMSVDVSRTDERDVTEDQEEEITQLMRDFADWIYDQLRAENDYLYSDENVDETIRANEYEFSEDGERI